MAGALSLGTPRTNKMLWFTGSSGTYSTPSYSEAGKAKSTAVWNGRNRASKIGVAWTVTTDTDAEAEKTACVRKTEKGQQRRSECFPRRINILLFVVKGFLMC